jgi:hypothetical protein
MEGKALGSEERKRLGTGLHVYDQIFYINIEKAAACMLET